MENSKLLKKIIIKIVLVLIIIIIFIIQYFYFIKTTSTPVNTTINTGDARMTLDIKKYLYRDIDYFFECLKSKEYEKAFNLLCEESRSNTFANDLSDFETKMKLCINSDICEKKIRYVNIEESIERRKEVYYIKSIVYFDKMNEEYTGNVDTEEMQSFFAVKNFSFKIVEERPFDFKMYLVEE